MKSKDLIVFKETIRYEKEAELIWVKYVCDHFKIPIKNQYTKIKTDPLLSKVGTDFGSELGVIDKNGRILLTKKGFLRWIQIINAKLLDEQYQESFIQYQSSIFDYFFGSAEREAQIKATYQRRNELRQTIKRDTAELKEAESTLEIYLSDIANRNQLPIAFETTQLPETL